MLSFKKNRGREWSIIILFYLTPWCFLLFFFLSSYCLLNLNFIKIFFFFFKKDFLNEGVTIITKPQSFVNNNQFLQQQQQLNNSNATLDKLLKSLDDINSYLEKKFSKNKFQQNNKTIEEDSIIGTKSCLKKNSEPDIKSFSKNLNESFYLLDSKYSYLNLNKHRMSVDV